MIRSLRSKIRAATAKLWQDTRLLLGVLGLVRFHLIMLGIGLVLVLGVGQAKDLLIYYGLKCNAGFSADVVFFVATAMACALTIWYSARVMFRFRFVKPDQRLATEPAVAPSDQKVLPWLKHHLPRWLGAAVFAILLLGLWGLWDTSSFEPWTLVIVLLVALSVFVVFVNLRRRWFGLPSYREQKTHNNLNDYHELPLSTRRWFWFMLLSNVAVMAAAVMSPHALAAVVGPGGVMLLGAALSVVVGSMLVYASNWWRFPVVTVTLACIALFSLTNGNHLIRLCPDMVSTGSPERCAAQAATPVADSAHDALEQWVVQRKGEHARLPLIIVAAEGGGIRAGFWTAAVLAQLEEASPVDAPTSDYVFGISSVSGGSLGAAVYASMTAQGGAGFPDRSRETLSRDFLGPTLVTLMFPDLLQRFLPLPIFEDRAMTLEQSFERAWRETAGSDQFAAPFLDLWQSSRSVPFLFVNSTMVETGERLVYAPFPVQGMLDARDGRAVLGNTVPLSTVVHNSARFPYVSPAGLVRRQDTEADDQREHWARLVDGGYFENSGSQTALELLEFVQSQRANIAARHGVELVPYVIQITNSEANPVRDCDRARASLEERAQSADCFKRRFLPETFSPLFGVLNARTAHTRLAMDKLRDGATDARYAHFPLRDNGIVHPLGWMLAQPSRDDMRCQIVGYDHQDCVIDSAPAKDVDVRAVFASVLSFIERTLDSPQP
ncbi:MAG: hypothetical protein AB8G16_10780 [Gammaproteobacteria bacterium]